MTSGARAVMIQEGRRGDDGQLRALAEGLGRPGATVDVRLPLWRVVRDRITAALGLRVCSPAIDRFGPPWPDAVFVVGGRSVGLARHIRRRSGGRTRLVAVGRPWARLDRFDLVVTTPQYNLPEAPNVLHNRLPLNGFAPDALNRAAEAWRPAVDRLPGPYVTVLLGGDSSSHTLDAATARHLAARASRHAWALGGSVLACSSPRTPAAACEAFAANLAAPHAVHRWKPDQAHNPVPGYVGLADRLLVTGESASMLAEAARTGKPVEIVPLPLRRRAALLTRTLPAAARRLGADRGLAALRRNLTRLGLWVPARDTAALRAALDAAAVDAGAGCVRLDPAADDDLDRAVAAVRALLPDGEPEPAHGDSSVHLRPAA